jgi:hypothetical protein
MMSAARRAGWMTAGLLPAAALARLGLPALAAAVILAGAALGVACWVIASDDRSDRVTRMIYARHGDARSLTSRPPAAPALADRRRPARAADTRPGGDLRATQRAERTPLGRDAYRR